MSKNTDASNLADSQYSSEVLADLRKALDKCSLEALKNALVLYTETIELINSRFEKTMSRDDRANWALAMAMNPEWYGSAFSDRLQNTMLVSALLITVTASLFLSPPDSLPEDGVSTGIFFFVTGTCNIFFHLLDCIRSILH